MKAAISKGRRRKSSEASSNASGSKDLAANPTALAAGSELVVKDDTSVESGKSYGLSESESVIQKSIASRQTKDSDSELSILKNKPGTVPAKEIVPFRLETPTTLVFVSLDGLLTDFKLNHRLQSYSDMQREIAKVTKKSRLMFAVQDEKGYPITSTEFSGYDIIRVKEIAVRPVYKQLKLLQANWEQNDYHDIALNRAAMGDDVADSVSYLSQNSDMDDFGKL